jgi:pimeloyl-ACP methyl ester carboxylesterase
METFSIHHQPAIIEQVLRWLLLHHFADERELILIPYGHSMGGLALAQSDLGPLQAAVASQGRDLRIQKVLSAPAFVLREEARQNFNKLSMLKSIKRTFGRIPLYERLAQSLFTALAPILYRRSAENYSLNPDCSFIDFRRYNPFVLLDQGLELLNLNYGRDHLAALLDGSHLVLCHDDGMVDSAVLQSATRHANSNGASVKVHEIDSSHNPERDDPHLILDAMCTIVQPLITSSVHATPTAVPMPG